MRAKYGKVGGENKFCCVKFELEVLVKTHGVYTLHRQIGIKVVVSECECV